MKLVMSLTELKAETPSVWLLLQTFCYWKTGPQFVIRMGAHMEIYFLFWNICFLAACHILELL